MNRRPLLFTVSVFGLSALLTACAVRNNERAAEQPQVVVAENLCLSPPVQLKSFLNEDLDALSLADLTALAGSGNTDALVLLGLRYTAVPSPNELEKAELYAKAIALFRTAADKGQSHAEYLLGVAYLSGAGVTKDPAEAVSWFARSAEHGNPLGQYWIGEMHAKGRGGLTPDWKTALPYFKGAAAGGVTDAIFELGYMYNNGEGELKQDYEKAATCYRRAQRSQLAQYNLRMLIIDGHIARQDGDPVIKPKQADPGE